ncbi:MAG: class I SAM-dependent methyltransferase [bacterium]|nr:class I SAM-dependent methyltransferase [bacterium]
MRSPDFDRLYREDRDPFGVGTRWYEVRKRGLVLASLASPRYRLAWDAAAGTGHLSGELAQRAAQVIASDASAVAISQLTGLPANVSAVRSSLPAIPEGARSADLAIVSEVLYYLDDDDRAATAATLASLQAEIVSVQWRHHPEDAYCSGADADAELADRLQVRFQRHVHHDEPDFVISTYRPRGEDHR